MEQRVSVLTIAAADLAAMRNFYTEVLGWKVLAENKDIVFFKCNGFLLSICERKGLAGFIGIDPEGQGFRSLTIGYNVDTKEEVTEHYQVLKAKGVRILKEPTEVSFGAYFFYFADIEGNILEIAYNPYVILDELKNAVDHQPIALL